MPSYQQERAFLFDVYQGNESAINMTLQLTLISQVWDDLVDGDQVSPELISKAFTTAMVHLPRNAFYREHEADLRPIVEQAILDWLCANDLERGGVVDKEVSFVLRDSLIAVVQRAAALIGGWDWANKQGPRIRRFFHDELLTSYLADLKGREVGV